MKISNIKKTLEFKKFVPEYRKHISDNIILVGGDRLLFTVKIDGTSFITTDDVILQNSFVSFANFLTFLGKDYGGRLAIWTHIVKKRSKLQDVYRFENMFISKFAESYLQQFSKQKFYETSYYITFSLKYLDLIDGEQDINTILLRSENMLRQYNGVSLSLVDVSETTSHSQLGTFLSSLINGEDSIITLSDSNFQDSICNSDIFFNYDFIEIRNKNSLTSKFATCYSLRDYPAETYPNMWDFLLDVEMEFILTQSFLFMSTQRSIATTNQQINKLQSVNSDIEEDNELVVLKRSLEKGGQSLGVYSSSFVAFGDSPDNAIANGVKLATEFINFGGGVRWSKATLDNVYSYCSNLPNSKFLPFNSIRTTTNLSCGFSMHNYYGGKQYGNPIGDGSAILPLKTRSGGIYFYNSHFSDFDRDERGKKISGHVLILGATGFGKTTTEAVIFSFLQRFNPNMFVIDYNRSTELYMRAFGAEYYVLKLGQETGLNPFQLEDTASDELKQFLYNLVYVCARDTEGRVTDEERKQLKLAVDSVLSLPRKYRRFSALLQSIPKSSLLIRLEKWCITDHDTGVYAWALDSPVNKFDPDNFNKIAFDLTALLKKGARNFELIEPILLILFYYKSRMQRSGNLTASIIEEFWIPCSFELTANMIEDSLKAGRMKNEFVYLVSQSPNDVFSNDISTAVAEQTQTKIFLGNPFAKREGYADLKCTEKEINIISSLNQQDRCFLIKQGNFSSVAKLDLSDSLYFLPILSSSQDGIVECEKLREKLGDDPANWVDVFLEKMNNK